LKRVAVVVAWSGEQIPHLISSLNSIDSQTYVAHQKILVTDGFLIDNALSQKFPDWKIIPNLTDIRGPAVSRNLAFDCLDENVDFVLISDADDVSHPQRIEKLIGMVVVNELDLVGSRAVIISRSKILNRKMIFPYPKMPKSEKLIRRRLLKNRPGFVAPTIMFRKSILDFVGNYNISLLRGEDMDFLRRAVMFDIKIGNSEEFLYGYRQHLLTRYRYMKNDLRYTGRADIAPFIYVVHLSKRMYTLMSSKIKRSDKVAFNRMS
jgi:hypothetical protein